VRAAAEPFVLWDVGLGAAANAIAVLKATRDLPTPIHLLSFDHTLEPLRFGLRHAVELGYLEDYQGPLARFLEGNRRVELSEATRTITWDLLLDDFPTLIASPTASGLPPPHAVLFDAFSPATNPEMWTLPLFERLYHRLDPKRPCALPTYSRSTMLRVTLLLAGFRVGRGHPTGLKEETTIAANVPELIEDPLGQDWLARVRRSTSAEPLRGPRYRQARLSPESWERLQRHPQFMRAATAD
jgi:tRNA U34 5-methylaminomethyl-2-thiouridine-forming methyltransferase MnmC